MTELLYLSDNDRETEFSATVIEATGDYLVLGATHFYPEGGGQPADHGTLHWEGGEARITDVQKRGGEVRHTLEDLDGDLPEPGDRVRGEIDIDRREAHRRMHTAQHVVSKVVLDEFDAGVAGNQIHAETSRIDFEPAAFSEDDLELIEDKANAVIADDLLVAKKELPRSEIAERMADGRVDLSLIPDHVDPLRVIVIEDFDVCPCGGTHVDRLAEIGQIKIVDRVSKGADVDRIIFTLHDADR